MKETMLEITATESGSTKMPIDDTSITNLTNEASRHFLSLDDDIKFLGKNISEHLPPDVIIGDLEDDLAALQWRFQLDKSSSWLRDLILYENGVYFGNLLASIDSGFTWYQLPEYEWPLMYYRRPGNLAFSPFKCINDFIKAPRKGQLEQNLLEIIEQSKKK